jgi:hypothetical protein
VAAGSGDMRGLSHMGTMAVQAPEHAEGSQGYSWARCTAGSWKRSGFHVQA